MNFEHFKTDNNIMTQIIGFAGSKQSGKNTACNFILAIKIAELGISKSSRLNKFGEIEITDIFNERVSNKEWFPFQEPYVEVETLFNNELGKFIKLYSFLCKKLFIFFIVFFGLNIILNIFNKVFFEFFLGRGIRFK